MFVNKLIISTLLLLIITGCATDSPPKNQNNICNIYQEKREWYKASLNMERKWGVPVQIPMAFIHQESRFDGTALPPRKYILGIIPWGRVSTSYGFAQAQTATWSDYMKETGRVGARRNNFADCMDFIGWYISKAQRVNGVSKWDSYNQYLNYHEGMGGYKRKTYQNKAWLINVAKKVQTKASDYGTQYRSCQEQLNKPQSVWERIF